MVDAIDYDGDRELWGVNKYFDSVSGVKALVKTIKALISWADVFGYIDKKTDQPWAQTHTCMDITKKALSGAEIPGKTEKLVRSVIKVYEKPTEIRKWRT